jgi:hypothetical protein
MGSFFSYSLLLPRLHNLAAPTRMCHDQDTYPQRLVHTSSCLPMMAHHPRPHPWRFVHKAAEVAPSRVAKFTPAWGSDEGVGLTKDHSPCAKAPQLETPTQHPNPLHAACLLLHASPAAGPFFAPPIIACHASSQCPRTHLEPPCATHP